MIWSQFSEVSVNKLDSMCWFFHQRSHAPEDHSRKKCWMRTAPQRTTPEQKCRNFSFSVPGDLDLWPLTQNSNSGQILVQCTTHLTAKFHHPALNCSKVIVLTNKLTNKQTNRCHWKHPPRFAMLCRWVIKLFSSDISLLLLDTNR